MYVYFQRLSCEIALYKPTIAVWVVTVFREWPMFRVHLSNLGCMQIHVVGRA